MKKLYIFVSAGFFLLLLAQILMFQQMNARLDAISKDTVYMPTVAGQVTDVNNTLNETKNTVDSIESSMTNSPVR